MEEWPLLPSEHERRFLDDVGPLCERKDYAGLLDVLRESWPPRRLAGFLKSGDPDVVARAAACLGYVGSVLHAPRLAPLLHSEDERVASSAEDALWNLWMRAFGPTAQQQLAAAIERIRQGSFDAALVQLGILLSQEPGFAEAHHQRAIALHSLERFDEALAAYRETVRLNPDHFAAWAGLGHVSAEQGDFVTARDAYRKAVQINPRLSELREVLPQLERAIERRSVA